MNVDAGAARTQRSVFQMSTLAWAIVVLALIAGYFGFKTGVDFSANWIWMRPEYSHGILIPFIAAFLVWQRKDRIERLPFTGSWWGLALLLAAAALNLMGKMAALFAVQQYAVVVAIYALVLTLVGGRVFRLLWVPLLILLFMIPLPEFVLQNLSAQLQLISSQIGVWVIRLLGISVYLEGNVIDLGVYKLQVAEACDGLRYLFPLMTLGFIMAYFFQAAMWKRILVFLSSVPLTILMNSFRIGVIGITVEHWGIGMAEGFLHEFQGWAVFMASMALMLCELMLLARLGARGSSWREVFGLEFPAPAPKDAAVHERALPRSFLAATAVLITVATVAHLLPERQEIIPNRSSFVDFPNLLEGWAVHQEPLDPIYRDTLKLDDYLMATLSDGRPPSIVLYVAWYDTQRAGRSTHSPRTCLPSGGWKIDSFTQVSLPGAVMHGRMLTVNRAVTSLRTQRELVYYWFSQRGRVATNEYMVKWLLFWDSLTRNRSDGALIRISMSLDDGAALEAADARLREFTRRIAPRLDAYVPD